MFDKSFYTKAKDQTRLIYKTVKCFIKLLTDESKISFLLILHKTLVYIYIPVAELPPPPTQCNGAYKGAYQHFSVDRVRGERNCGANKLYRSQHKEISLLGVYISLGTRVS